MKTITQGKEVKVKVMSVNSGETWEESFTSFFNPKEEFENILKKWNNDFPNAKRKLVEIIGDTGIKYCNLIKMNKATVLRNKKAYDILACTVCGIVLQRHGLGQNFNYKPECQPTRTCTECNRIFKTENGLKKHNDIGKHETPEWLPDGV